MESNWGEYYPSTLNINTFLTICFQAYFDFPDMNVDIWTKKQNITAYPRMGPFFMWSSKTLKWTSNICVYVFNHVDNNLGKATNKNTSNVGIRATLVAHLI